MDFDEIIKAIANPTRRQMLSWLKEPDKHFEAQPSGHPLNEGVCVGKLVEKTGLSQSTVSAYLDSLQRAGLVTARRQGQWTFYTRNDAAIAEFIAAIGGEI